MENNTLSIVIVGHVDHGKSSLVGRLLYDTNSLSEDKLEELKKASMSTENELEFAFLLDHLKEEREQNITIDTTQTVFRTSRRFYRIIDAPGHVEFVKNMITGATAADTAILILDVNDGIREQTKRHAFILSFLGINKIIVAVNKMDMIGYSEDIYNKIVDSIRDILLKLKLNVLCFIPISALKGDNVCFKSKNMPWYLGNSLLTVLEKTEVKKDIQGDTVFSVQDVYKMGGKRIAVGIVESGALKTNDAIIVKQSEQKTSIKSIEKFMAKIDLASAGECVGITLKDPVFLEKGSVLCCDEKLLFSKKSFIAKVFWFNKKSLKLNEKFTLKCGTQEIVGFIRKINYKINTDKLLENKGNFDSLEFLDAAEVEIETKNNLVFSEFSKFQNLGRFVIITDLSINGGGVIVS